MDYTIWKVFTWRLHQIRAVTSENPQLKHAWHQPKHFLDKQVLKTGKQEYKLVFAYSVLHILRDSKEGTSSVR
jgi:hypothetical protein